MHHDSSGAEPPKEDAGDNGQRPDGKKVLLFPGAEERRRRKVGETPQKDTPMGMMRGAGKAQASQPFFNIGKIPPFTLSLGAFMIAAHILISLTMGNSLVWVSMVYMHGFVPAQFLATPLDLATLASPLTYALLHGGFVHIAFNMVMFFSLGTFYERRFGIISMAVTTFICAVSGALGYFLFDPHGQAPLIGASAITSGLFAVFLIDYMKLGLDTPWARRQFLKMLGFWVIFMLISGTISGDNVAWQAHLGGFAGGVAIMLLRLRGRRAR